MLSLPTPRINCASRCSSSTVDVGWAIAPMCEVPNSAFTRFKPSATYCKAVGQSTTRHASPWRICGCVKRRSLLKASYEKRSRSAIQHSLTASFSIGTTRSTWLPLTCTIKLAPTLSCGLTLLRRESSQVRAL
jgi:hypothetical protein